MKIVSGPIEQPIPYPVGKSCLDAVCHDDSCAASVLIEDDQDLYFVSAVLDDEQGGVAALLLCWRCPYCGTQNGIEEWILSETLLSSWPPPLTRVEVDENPASALITREARIAALHAYLAGR